MPKKIIKAADIFCGAGGTSSGMIRACKELGLEVHLTAINHWDVAVATHQLNHPSARHLCTGIDNVNPRDLFKEGELDILWASPECTHHSTARGGKPINDQSRATAWCVVRWADAVRPKRIWVENVPEFLNWCRTKRVKREVKVKVRALKWKQWKRIHKDTSRKDWKANCPIKKITVTKLVDVPDMRYKGEIFHSWANNLRAFGYQLDWKVIVCANHGDPTTRERLFVQAVLGTKNKIVWPNKTHAPKEEIDLGDMFEKALKPWVPARDCIDLTDRGASIFSRKRPLVRKTLERIIIGMEKFSGFPFLVQPGHGAENAAHNNCRATSIDNPLGTLPCSNRFGVAQPYLVNMKGNSDAASIEKPSPTLTAHAKHMALAQAFLIGQQSGATPRGVNEPAPTIATAGAISKVDAELKPFIVGCGGPTGSAKAKSIDEPSSTVIAQDRRGVVNPYLIKLKGTSNAASIEQPSPAICAGGTHLGLAEPVLIEGNHGDGKGVRRGRARSINKPIGAVTSKNGLGVGVAEFILATDHTGGNGHQVRSSGKPLSAITTKQRHALSSIYLVKFNGTGTANSIDDPIGAITTRDRFGLVHVDLVEVILEHASKSMGPPILEIDGQLYQLQIYFRMLRQLELALCQGFPKDYLFTGTGEQITKQIGNAVPTHTAYALVKAGISQTA